MSEPTVDTVTPEPVVDVVEPAPVVTVDAAPAPAANVAHATGYNYETGEFVA